MTQIRRSPPRRAPDAKEPPTPSALNEAAPSTVSPPFPDAPEDQHGSAEVHAGPGAERLYGLSMSPRQAQDIQLPAMVMTIPAATGQRTMTGSGAPPMQTEVSQSAANAAAMVNLRTFSPAAYGRLGEATAALASNTLDLAIWAKSRLSPEAQAQIEALRSVVYNDMHGALRAGHVSTDAHLRVLQPMTELARALLQHSMDVKED